MSKGPSSAGVFLVTRRAVHQRVKALSRSATLSYILYSRRIPRRLPFRGLCASVSFRCRHKGSHKYTFLRLTGKGFSTHV